MSLENEGQMSQDKGSEEIHVALKNQTISYSREFLLSFTNLDICKKLPSGLGESLISEFEDALVSIPDRPRIPGSTPLQGFRRNDYSSSPPTRGDSGNYSRCIYGKWESRSSGRSDRDSDSQSDRDSDSGRRYGHQSRRPWQTPEHDGLLGSGSFPRPSGYASGVPAPKARTNEPYQLSKSNEPYHPPRPYKEQHKALQEKQKLNLDKHKTGGLSDFSEVLEDSKEEKGIFTKNNELEVSAAIPIPSNDLEKSSFASHSPASRPLVPPGFKNSSLEKSSVLKSVIRPPLSDVGKSVTGESLVDAEANLVQNGSSDGLERRLSQEISLVDGLFVAKTHHTPLLNKGENVNLHVNLDVPIKNLGMEDHLLRVAGHFNSHGTLDDPETAKHEVLGDKNVGDSDRSHSTSILEKIFSSTLSMNDGGLSSTEHHDSKPDDTWSPNSAHSSKFAQWFIEEETKAADDISSARPNDLLSLIVTANGVSDQEHISNKEDAIPAVLTCEDLEQSILSQYSEKTTKMQSLPESWSTTGVKDQPSAHADNHASLNLLSMLQKGTDQSNMTSKSGVGINLADELLVSRENDMATIVKEPKGEENKSLPNLGNNLTLEALFGSSFMKELKSVEAPVSVQRGSSRVDAPEAQGLPFTVKDIEISSTRTDKSGLQRPIHDYGVSSDHRQQMMSKHHAEAVPKHSGFEGVFDFQLPEEDNLISPSDTRNKRIPTSMPTGNLMNNVNFSPSAPIDIMEKLAAFGADIKGQVRMGGSENLPFTGGPYEQMGPEIPYRNIQMQQQSSPHFHQPAQMTQMRPLHHHLGSQPTHMSPQMKFVGPEPIFNQDSPANHQFSSSSMIRPPFSHPNVRVAGFDASSHHSMLHQMQMSGNHPPPHMLPDFPRGGPISHHGNQATGLIPEMSQMHGFPLGPRHPNIVNRGVRMAVVLVEPAQEINPGSTPPEAFQRLLEMELRANSKQIHPLAPGHSQVMSGHDIDMGFRYR
ncbi:hypothetical protein BUALT_Bualt01G0232300 [Buddleja alternifolia]|uniref:Uncharacterized protein n=1 Tax=Buddleja alternifolia TaxID=168488 RepID=A0AAV6YAK2_9LAMI|nr:hypothetical protein BUALT_Bualt01G0232300 [Buddleja alternifolia]